MSDDNKINPVVEAMDESQAEHHTTDVSRFPPVMILPNGKTQFLCSQFLTSRAVVLDKRTGERESVILLSMTAESGDTEVTLYSPHPVDSFLDLVNRLVQVRDMLLTEQKQREPVC